MCPSGVMALKLVRTSAVTNSQFSWLARRCGFHHIEERDNKGDLHIMKYHADFHHNMQIDNDTNI